MSKRLAWFYLAVVWITASAAAARSADGDELFRGHVAPVLERRCVGCHNDAQRKGDLSLATAKAALAGGESGPVIEPGDAAASLLVEYISGDKPEMPKQGGPLSRAEVDAIRRWIAAGAKWPAGMALRDKHLAGNDWWSLRPIVKHPLPKLTGEDARWVRTPIDAFILARLRDNKLAPSPEADRRTLIRRLYFDLAGLPPPPEEVDAFVADRDPRSYERLVDRLLASPHYGERWARHWLDVVHYGDTHGYDKDKVRPNAWPYRDYVIRALDADKSYARFVEEQIAGDVLYPHTADGVVATGFIAAGPWDFVGHVELREGTTDKKITRNLDRDDMVATTMNTFTSTTVQCARCHNHKFDPVTQKDYYSLQAVFAAVDRADRPYDVGPQVARRRGELEKRRAELVAGKERLDLRIAKLAGPELAAIDGRIAELNRRRAKTDSAAFGYHSRIESRPEVTKWVQVDLGRAVAIRRVIYVACHDDFAGIGAGFGFPVRYKIEASDDPRFASGVVALVDHTDADVANPGVKPQSVLVEGIKARYVRVTATRLAHRQKDYIFALAELIVLDERGENAAAGAAVTSLDSIEAPIRWQRVNLVDGYYKGVKEDAGTDELAELAEKRRLLLSGVLAGPIKKEVETSRRGLEKVDRELAALPKKGTVYAAATSFAPQGSFHATGGRPRAIHVLARGSVKNPLDEVRPGTLSCLENLDARFPLSATDGEGQRRAALARWIIDRRNPLTWRSIVNRVWHYHFGRGIVDTPSDFGRMGSRPTHPRLLDWLAAEFRDGRQSLKDLHRLIVTSAVYRQSSAGSAAFAKIDAGNRFLWRMNRQRLEAEAIRDAVLSISGKLDRRMYGPGFRPFGFKDDHSPHYKYHEHDPDDPRSHRRSIYRFIVRSVPDPLMETLDCADPSQAVPKRNETLTALQALALLNNKFMVRMAEHFAKRVEGEGDDVPARIDAAFCLALGRPATDDERRVLTAYANRHGLANACRVILNMNEFVFVD